MKCININDPEVQQFISLFGQVTTAAIIDEYNKSYADRDLDLDLANFIFGRLRKEDKKKFERPIVSKNILDIEAFQKLIENPQYFEEIQKYLTSIDWFRISDAANKKLKQDTPRALRAEAERLQALTPQQARDMAEGLLIYLTETYTYLDKVKRDLRAFFNTEGVPLTEKYKKGYFTKQMVDNFLENMEDWKKSIKGLDSTNIISRLVDSLRSVKNDVDSLFKENALDTISEELANEMWPQTDQLIKENNKEIERIQQLKKLAKDPRDINFFNERLRQLEERKKLYATKENLLNALKKGLSSVGQEDINWFSLLMENARMSSNIITGTVGSYIYNLHNETTREVIEYETRMKNLSKEILKEFKGRLTVSGNKEDLMKPYVREVTEMYIDKDGNEKFHKVYVLNSEMDEAGYKLELEKKKLEISRETDPNRKKVLERELKKFRDENEDRGLTEEYYRIMSLLSPEAKEARAEIISAIQRLASYSAEDILDEGTLDEIADLQYQLQRLESLYYDNGNRKPPGSLDEKIALDIQAWKKETKANKLFVFEPSLERLEEFNFRKKQYEDKIATAEQDLVSANKAYLEQGLDYNAVVQARNKVNQLKKDFLAWKKINTRRVISQDFYELRSSITDQISAIQEKYKSRFVAEFPNLRTDGEIWEEIFNLLKGYRDQDNVYMGTDIPAEISEKVKELQLELRANKELYKTLKRKIKEEDRASFKVDQDRLEKLYDSLQQLQNYQQTEYYKKAYSMHLSQIRAMEVYRQAQKDKVTEIDFKANYNNFLVEARTVLPGGTLAEHQKYATDKANELVYARLAKDEETLEAKVLKQFKNSKWFQENHIKMDVWDPTVEQMVEQDVPLYFWNEVLPRNEVYINWESPSARWNSFDINSDFKNKDFRYIPGRTQLRKTSTFRNQAYDNLSSKEKELLQRLTDIYEDAQRRTPYSTALGLKLPSVRKREQTNLIDYANPVKRVVTWGTNFFDEVRGLDEEKEEDYGTDKPSTIAHRRLLLRYTSRMDSSMQSIDALTSITMFGSDAIRFGKLFEKMPFLYGIQDQLTQGPNADSNTTKMLNNLFETQLYGRGMKTMFKGKGKAATAERLIYKASDESLKAGAFIYLGLKAPNAIKNFLANLSNALIQSGTYGINPKTVAIEALVFWMGKSYRHIHEIFLSAIQTGDESEFVKKLRFFGIYDENVAEKARMLNPTDLQTLGVANPFKLLLFSREFLDITTRIAVSQALAENYMFQDRFGNNVSIFDAYEFVGEEFKIKDGLFLVDENGNKIQVTEKDVEDIKRRYVGKYTSIDGLINGAQKNIDKAEITRYGIGRLLMFMKSWLAYQGIRRYGGKRISYGGGFEYEGMHRALGSMMYNFFKNLPAIAINLNSFYLRNKAIDPIKKKAALAAVFDTVYLGVLMSGVISLSMSVYGDDPEDEETKKKKYWNYWWLYMLSYLTDELETLHPVAGPFSYIYGRQVERNTKDNAFVYGAKKQFLEPYRGVYEIYKTMALFYRPEVDMTAPYVHRNRDGNVITRKGIPVNPALANPVFGDDYNSELYAKFLQTSGLAANINFVRNPEYMFSTFKHFYPKKYIIDLKEDVEGINAEVNFYKKEIKNLKQELKVNQDATREETIKLLMEDYYQKLDAALDERQNLLDFQDNDLIGD